MLRSLAELSEMTSESGAPKPGAVGDESGREKTDGLISRDRLPPGLQ